MPPIPLPRFLLGFLLSLPSAAFADHWVATWGASPSPQLPTEAKMRDAGLVFENQTLREIVHVSLGGTAVRVRLSNAYGAQPIRIAAAHLALSAGGSRSIPGSDRTLTFGGRGDVLLPSDASALSDPVELDVPEGGNLAVSLFLPARTLAAGIHYGAEQTSSVAAGDQTAAAALPDSAKTLTSWTFLAGVDILAPDSVGAVVAIGDSITDGVKSAPNANHRWPDFLAKRLLARREGPLATVNAGIGGNRLLHDPGEMIPYGVNALARFDRDVIAVPGVRDVIVLEGINDIGQPGWRFPLSESVGARDIIAALGQLIARAHEHGLRIFGATITPFAGVAIPGYYSPEKERTRQAVNAWIRGSGAFDGVIDFERAVQDPARPQSMNPAYDSGDHLHPNDRGYEAMGRAVDLSLFR